MAEASFADRYAEAGIAPSAEIIQRRQTSAERIVDAATAAQILDLVTYYFDLKAPDPVWLRDEFLKDDPTFSLINNRREAQTLCAIMLSWLVAGGTNGDLAALALVVGHLGGNRAPQEAGWLLAEAYSTRALLAVKQRAPQSVEPKVQWTATKGLEQEIAAVPANEWATLLSVIGKVRKESQSSMSNMSTQATAIAAELMRRTDYQREETQILWWVFGGQSRSLERPFATLEPPQAAVVAAIDLGALTTVSRVGPIAAPALLAKVIAGAKKSRAGPATTLADAIDNLQVDDLAKLDVDTDKASLAMMPVMGALTLAKTMGAGAWHRPFAERTGLAVSIAFEPIDLAQQLYNELLLGQIL